MNRIHEGYVYVRNPYYRNQVSKYSLSNEVVDCLSFCTKNPYPMLKYLDELKSVYNMFWFVTITPYEKDIEPNVPSYDDVIKSFKELSTKLGKNSVALRYDPVFINDKYTIEEHIKKFREILEKLKGYTEDVTISFLDMYDKVKKNAPNIRPPSKKEEFIIAREFVKIGRENNMVVHGCCENVELKEVGLEITGCMSKEIVEKSIGKLLNPPSGQSKRIDLTNSSKLMCNCLMGNDIGAYNTCMHLCKYCYANFNKELVIKNNKKHNPKSPFLIGDMEEDDKISIAKQKSWIKHIDGEQITLF